jgi:hypothetical protein
MRLSRILIMNWIGLLICGAAYCAGWLWTYQHTLVALWKDGL